MAELADAHGSGPCESDFMQVQVLLSAPKNTSPCGLVFFYRTGLEDELQERESKRSVIGRNSPVDCFVRGWTNPASPTKKGKVARKGDFFFFCTVGGFEDELQECEQKKHLHLSKCFFITFSVVYTKSTLQGGVEEVLSAIPALLYQSRQQTRLFLFSYP